MIGYVVLGTNQFDRAAKFYDTLATEFGCGRMMTMDRFIAWGKQGGGCWFSICKPYDGKPATVGNGVMAAFAASSKEQVDRVYKKALELGGTDEGPPGQRMDGFYAAYFRDLDGNKLNAFFMG
jgi:hypothetical protein